MIHDNDTILTAVPVQALLSNTNIKVMKTSFRLPWQNGVCERVIGILRAELLNHVIPFNEKHLEYLLRQYFQKYYHTERTHQGINCQIPILGGLYHSYKEAA